MTTRLVFGFILGFCLQSSVQGADGITLERDTNRPGMDYANFELEQANPNLCRQACAQDAQCKAFTYVKSDARVSKARCWLKQGVPAPVADDCCVSGTKSQTKTIKGKPSPLVEIPKSKQESIPGDEFERIPEIPKHQIKWFQFDDRVLSFQTRSELVTCDSGYEITGGGCWVGHYDGVITETRPATYYGRAAWKCGFKNTRLNEKSVTSNVAVWAICMRIDE